MASETELGKAVIPIRAAMDGLDKDLDEAKGKVETASTGISGALSKIKWAAVGAGAATTVGALSGVAKEASRFEAGMREVNTLANLSESELKELSTQTRELSERLGVDAVGSSKALYQAISASVPADNAISFLEIASRAAIGGITDTETAVDGLTTVLNAFKMDTSEAQNVADIMFTTVKQGKTDFGQLSGALFNVAPIAATAGVSFEEVSASIATLTKQGTPTSVATTQIRAAIQGLLRPSEEMTAIFNELGYESAAAAIEAEGLNFALDAVNTATSGDVGAMTKLLGSIEAVSATLGTTGQNADMFAGDLAAMNSATGASTKAFEEMNKSSERWGDMVKAKMQSASIAMGEFLGPAQGMIALLPGLSAGFTGLGGAVGVVLPALGGLKTALMTSVIPSIGATIVALGPILIPLGLITAAVALLAFAWSNNWGDIQGKTQVAWEFIQSCIEVAWALVSGIITAGLQLLSGDWEGAWDTMQETLDTVWSSIKTLTQGAWDGLVEIIKGAVNSIIGFINGMIGAWNSLRFERPRIDIPDWVPGIGGQAWGGNVIAVPQVGTIPLLAGGGEITSPGLSVVGERGPELLELPRGAQVTPLSGSQSAFDYDQMAKAIAKQLKPSLNVQTTIVSPEPLSPSRIRHQQETMLRSLALEYGF